MVEYTEIQGVESRIYEDMDIASSNWGGYKKGR
jgi:hypothetical protein